MFSKIKMKITRLLKRKTIKRRILKELQQINFNFSQQANYQNEILNNILNTFILVNSPDSIWNYLREERLKNEKYLDKFGYKIFSQTDEDGIINEIFYRIGVTNKTVIEFGVQSGIDSNSHYLLDLGWKVLWIDSNTSFYQKGIEYFKTAISEKRLTFLNKFITRENINQIFKDADFTGEIDLLSVDIDGNDYHILEEILKKQTINPRVIVLEYNTTLPPQKDKNDTSADFIIEYKADRTWKHDNRYGASLSSFYRLGKKYNYTLVGTNMFGFNAFFVRNDLVQDKFINTDPGPFYFHNAVHLPFIKQGYPHKELYDLREPDRD